MKCVICNLSEDEAELFDGIYDNEVVKVCKRCAELENIPFFKKPTKEQVEVSERRYSVRERMERLSGNKKKLNKEQLIANENLNKLKMPPKKQHDKDLLDDYYWRLQMARRSEKYTINQLSQKAQIPVEDLQNLEKGVLPENFKEIIEKLELVLNIKLFKEHHKVINFNFPKPDEAQEILKKVKEKIEHQEEEKEPKEEKIKKLARGELDFSKRENIKDIKLKDLIDMKRKRDKEKMLGDEVELDGD
jgi:ribosome-binding protein aMBF1 (putative translation factor)